MKLSRLTLIVTALMTVLPFTSDAQKKEKSCGIVAHRGFWNCEEAGFAKNSIAALRCAQEAGFWGSEFDVHMTSDEVLLVYHDPDVEGKKIEKHPYEDFKYFRLANGEPIPTIDQYLEQGKKHPETVLVYELKNHSSDEIENRFVDITIEKLKEYELLDPSRVIFIAFSMNICKRLVEKLPGFTVQYLSGDKAPKAVKKEGINGIDYNYRIFDTNKKWVKEAQSLDMSVNSWTVNKEDKIVDMLNLGIDQITTDNPLTVRETMKKTGITELK